MKNHNIEINEVHSNLPDDYNNYFSKINSIDNYKLPDDYEIPTIKITDNVCHCALPALTGSNTCCENCPNNPKNKIDKSVQEQIKDFNKKQEELDKSYICPDCGGTLYEDGGVCLTSMPPQYRYYAVCNKCGHRFESNKPIGKVRITPCYEEGK